MKILMLIYFVITLFINFDKKKQILFHEYIYNIRQLNGTSLTKFKYPENV